MVRSQEREAGKGRNMTGEQLQSRRQRARISLRKLATRAGISPSYLCDLEWGKRTGERAQAQIDQAAIVLREMVEERKMAKP